MAWNFCIRRGLRDLALTSCQTYVLFGVVTGSTGWGANVFFQAKDTGHEDGFHYVVKGVYTSGTSTDQKKNARKLLEDIGVSEVGEAGTH